MFKNIKYALFFFCAAFFVYSFSANAAGRSLVILALGDSTTAGTPAFHSPAEKPPQGTGNEQSQYAYWMMRQHPEWTVLNRGIAGERADQIFERFKKYSKTEKPEIVIVLAGVNDLYQNYSAEEVEAKLTAIYQWAVGRKIRVVACTILPYDRSKPFVRQKMNEVNQWIRAYAERNGFLFCDTFKAVNNPEKYGKLTGTPDGLHPDVEGYKKIGEALTAVLEAGVGS